LDGESIVITFDPHPRLVLNPGDTQFKLLSSTKEKTSLLAKCGIDHVVLVPFTPAFAQQSAKEYVEDFLIKNFNPSRIVIGYDHRFGACRVGDIEFLKSYSDQFSVLEIPAQEIDEIAVSSTKIRRALSQNEIRKANRLLGHTYTLNGVVTRGNGIGQKIGFPTANLVLDSIHKLIPPPGIFAAQVKLDGKQYEAMLYIGNRPSIEGAEPEERVEVNIIDFDGDLYDQPLQVQILDFIRSDKKLDGLQALKEQIEQDKKDIQERIRSLETREKELDVAVAVVILNYNTRKHLQQFLPGVLQNSPQNARIIVADNGSPDDSVEVILKEFPEVELIDLHENYGFARGYNVALTKVEADIYVILNSDVEVSPGWMAPVLDAMEKDPSIAVAQPKILAWKNKSRFEHAGASGGWMDGLAYPFCRGRIFNHVEEDTGQYDEAQECFWASGAAFFIRAPLFHQFKGFDGDYFAHNEEIDLCWRLKRAGHRICCIPQSVVYHLGGGTLDYENPRKAYLNFRNSLFSIVKNEPLNRMIWLIPVRLMLDGVAAGMFLTQGKTKAIMAILRAHLSFYRQFSLYWRKRKAIENLVEKHRIGAARHTGIFRGSIVFNHYLKRVKHFSDLPKSKINQG
jgi:hypothetical protein